MPQPIQSSVLFEDLSARFLSTSAITGSPQTNEEAIVCTLTLSGFNDISVVSGVRLHGWAAFTVGTSGVSATFRLRQTNASGTVVKSSGALTVTAASLYAFDIAGLDAAPGVGVYVMTVQIGSGAAVSTVSSAFLSGVVI